METMTRLSYVVALAFICVVFWVNYPIRIESIRADLMNVPRNLCLSEYVLTFGRSLISGIFLTTGVRCLNETIITTFWGLAFHSYYYNHTLVGVRGKGTVHLVTAKTSEHLYMQCTNLLDPAISPDDIMPNASISSANISKMETPQNNRRIRPEKFHILFVFGLVTLGIFIVVLSVIIVYLGMLFARRRFRSFEPPMPRRGHVGPPMYPLRTDADMIFGEVLANQPPLREPLAPPAYIEDPPKYETLFVLPDIDSATSENHVVENENEAVNILPLSDANVVVAVMRTDEATCRQDTSDSCSRNVECRFCSGLCANNGIPDKPCVYTEESVRTTPETTSGDEICRNDLVSTTATGDLDRCSDERNDALKHGEHFEKGDGTHEQLEETGVADDVVDTPDNDTGSSA